MTDPDRDDYLREALRHAPDAQVQPPTALSALILNEARTKARDAKPPARPARSPLLGLWDWLARPSVAAGFAGLMAATLVGVMWWDQPMNEALPRPPTPATAAAPVLATPQATPSTTATQPPTPALTAEAERAAPEPPRLALRKPAPAADKAEVAKAPAAAAPTAQRAETTAGPAQAARGAAPSAILAPVPLPPPAAPPAAAEMAIGGATADVLPKLKSAEEAKRQSGAVAADSLSSKAAPKAELNEARMRIAQSAETRAVAMGGLRAAIAAEPARWTWQRGSDPAQNMNDAVYAWLAQLNAATGTDWQPRAERETATPLGRELRLMRDGRLMHSLRLTERGVLWEQGQGAWQVELPASTLTPLQTALDAVAP